MRSAVGYCGSYSLVQLCDRTAGLATSIGATGFAADLAQLAEALNVDLPQVEQIQVEQIEPEQLPGVID